MGCGELRGHAPDRPPSPRVVRTVSKHNPQGDRLRGSCRCSDGGASGCLPPAEKCSHSSERNARFSRSRSVRWWTLTESGERDSRYPATPRSIGITPFRTSIDRRRRRGVSPSSPPSHRREVTQRSRGSAVDRSQVPASRGRAVVDVTDALHGDRERQRKWSSQTDASGRVASSARAAPRDCDPA